MGDLLPVVLLCRTLQSLTAATLLGLGIRTPTCCVSDACSLPCDATADARTSDSEPLRPPSAMKAISRLPMASVSFITAKSLNLG